MSDANDVQEMIRRRAEFEAENPSLDLTPEYDPWGPIQRYLNPATAAAWHAWYDTKYGRSERYIAEKALEG